MAGEPGKTFFGLTPDRVLEAVEAGGLRSTGRCLPLRAFENRVYEVELDDERRVVVKFYRPGRWSRATIEDEHRFLADLAAAEVPAVAPMDLGTGTTLNEIDGILYAAFPKVRGRTLDELDAENRRRIGRTIGRLHAGGAARPATNRDACLWSWTRLPMCRTWAPRSLRSHARYKKECRWSSSDRVSRAGIR